MRKAKVFSTCVNGTFTQVKAYRKVNALARFKQMDPSIKASDVSALGGVQNSHQGIVEEMYPEICK